VLSRASGKVYTALTALAVAVVGSGCWEQVDPYWFPQMKQQPAVQALEGVPPLVPPDGTIPLGGIEPRIDHPAPAFTPEAMVLQNPVPSNPESIARGLEVYTIYCSVCHGADGMAKLEELPVAKRMAEGGMPPVPLMAVPAYTDGFLFTKIRYGKPGMPGYPQIEARDRWHVVNYLRTLIKGAATGE
jgi:mono/diheme cytochrome c family protein